MKIFIAEDDLWYSGVLKHHLSKNPEYEVHAFTTGQALLDKLNEKPDVISLDFGLPDYTGDKLLIKILSRIPNIPVVIVSGQEDIATAVALLQSGAYDYIVKNEDTKERLWFTLQRIKENLALKEEVIELREKVNRHETIHNSIIGSSFKMQQVFKLIEKAAGSSISVSISGETGTGKELVSQTIHDSSDRSHKPIVPVNVSAVPEGLIESELFGHEKGAFTGAMSTRIGKFEEAADGTLFLDEIGEMSSAIQAKLLRVLQEREFSRVGSNKMIKINCRVIVATHRDLGSLVREGKFRQDLFYRLIGLPILIPPLRDRKEDIPLIANSMLNGYAKEIGIDPPIITPMAMQALLAHTWPGNVRELKAVIQLSTILAEQGQIKPENIQFQGADSMADLTSKNMTLKEYNHFIIQSYLDKYENNVLEVAKHLDVGKSTIYRMLKEEKIKA